MKTNPVVAFIVALIAAASYALAQGQPPPPPAGEQAEVLTRGPVHEAFAEPVSLQPQAGLIVSSQPPATVDEVPPLERPQGDQYVWIPGYWSWDLDRNDFVWVSACWRMPPPNMYWVPGYWTPVADAQDVARGGVNVGVGGIGVHVGGGRVDVQIGRSIGVHVGGGQAAPVPAGWEWVGGFWARTSDQNQEIEYLPPPPAPFDLEPPGPAPAADAAWVPGVWYWQQNQYVRRPGYWLRQQADWVWVPSHYTWTPRGYVFIEGHWDYPLPRHGVLFAPVYFPPAMYARGGFSYTPTIAIDIGLLSANLFAVPRYGHYYFGDYYDDAYARQGIYPQFDSDRDRTWYDPIYVHDRWYYGRTDRQWQEHHRQEYDRLRKDRNLRPPHTYREMEARAARLPEPQRKSIELARPLTTFATAKTSPLKYKQMQTTDRQKIVKGATEVRKFREERGKWESAGESPAQPAAPAPAGGKKGAAPNPATPPPPTGGKTATPPVQRGAEYVRPRGVRATAPQRVKVAPPQVEKAAPAPAEQAPPRPPEEQKRGGSAAEPAKAAAKDVPKSDSKRLGRDETPK